MPYVGNPLANAFSSREKQDLTGQSGTSFTLTHSVSSPNDLSVYINHVRQEPTTAYTVNGTALTMTGSVAGTDDFYIIYDELAVQSISHPTNQALTATAGTFTSGLVGTTGTFSGALSGTTGTFSGALSAKGGVVFNEDSADVDFRVESNDQAYMLFVDAGNNRVGVNASTPLAKLQVEGTTDAELRITRTTASASGTFNDQGSVLNLFNDVEFENGYNGGASVGQILFTSDDGSTGQGIRAKIGCSKLGYSHAESLDFYVSPGNTASGQCTATSNTLGKRMTIDYAGRVGIATTPPGAEDTTFNNLHVGDQAAFGEYDGGSLYIVKNRYYNGSNWIAKENGGGSAINMDTSGNIHLQTSANVNAGQTGGLTTRVTVNDSNGLMYITGAYSVTTGTGANMYIQSDGAFYRSTSSKRYKNTIKDSTHGLAELLKLRSVTYKGNNDGDVILGGLIAEEVHDAGLTEFVQYNDDNEPDALSYGNMVSLCVKAIQEQQEQIKTLEAKVAELESK